MQSIKRILLIIILFFPLSTFGNTLTTGYQDSIVTISSGGSGYYEFVCSEGVTLNSMEFNLYGVTASQNVNIYLDSSLLTTITGLSTSLSNLETINLGNFVCHDGTYTLEVDVTSAGSVRTRNTITYAPQTIANNYLIDFTTQGNSAYRPNSTVHWSYPVFTVTGGGGSSSSTVATTTIISENDQLVQYFLLFAIFFMVLFGIIYLLKPFYVRK